MKRIAYCCDYIATTRKIYDFSVPRRNSGCRAATVLAQLCWCNSARIATM
ncbi:hypothetical protein ACSAZL_06995 [Methanosarcina sp. T3]